MGIESTRIVREPERRAKTGISTSTWYELQAVGAAPLPVKLTERSVSWLESELDAWLAARVAERGAAFKEAASVEVDA